jgi:hypothetical protein
MSEESTNKKNDLKQSADDAADNSEIISDETGRLLTKTLSIYDFIWCIKDYPIRTCNHKNTHS